MKVFRDLTEVPLDFGPSAVTIGKFDGVHAGHRGVIEGLRGIAAERGLRSVVVTFDRHPLHVIAPGKAPVALTGIEKKLDLLAETGIDAVLVLTFDRLLSALEPESFVRSILCATLDAKVVLVGDDFRYGHRGAGTVETLTAQGRVEGFEVVAIDDVMPCEGRRASSTWIRELLADGRVDAAADLLGHNASVRGTVVHGAKRGRELGFPTANLSPESTGYIPADGVYAGWLHSEGERYPAAISVGNNPTFDGVPQKQVEAFLLDQDIDLYDREVEVCFVERVRGMVAYAGIDPLIAQMHDDVVRVREILNVPAP
ncbi:bifunctional riboflavin kinase/FAD synthetase [Mycetocola tolaasinivorans]|uniref:Riboflavin biosynthesis protein n=1 Tax=Mycetocola tolaasinivorans TaxID=76635 RepID=A0A3L7A3B4_9MICO|nr:bifunctional riboflavin kinase/FAD synthetase [Mycetocola tolaasinivorans]RLP74749.1 bifunctional riboflavin kinase/FAD synthetase [Mycetocola tolaasinivorans]